jgi:hypothetical protein
MSGQTCRSLALAVFLVFSVRDLRAGDTTAIRPAPLRASEAYFPRSEPEEPLKEVESSSELTLQGSTRPEAMISFTQAFTFPFLQGDDFLTKGNNIKTVFSVNVTPVSLSGEAAGVLTPAAFLELTAGGFLGTGWNITMGRKPVCGLGLNLPNTGRENAFYGGNKLSAIKGTPLDGLVWKMYGGATLQFDTEAVWPGEWRHILFRAYTEMNYRAYTRATGGQSWVYEADNEENRNGWNYYGKFFIGYQMPLFLNMFGIQVEIDKYLYNTPNGYYWGDELGRWIFSGAVNFAVTPRFGAMFVVQCRTMRNYLDGDRNNSAHYFYQYREVDRSNPVRLEFYRVAAILTYKIK